MTDEEIFIHNEKIRFQLLMEMIRQIQRIEFKSEAGIKLHSDLVVCFSEVIKPIIKERATEFITPSVDKNNKDVTYTYPP